MKQKPRRPVTRANFPKRMVKLLDAVEVGVNQELFPPLYAARHLIKDLATFSRQTKIFKDSPHAITSLKEMTAEKAESPQDQAMVLWLYAIERFAKAPTSTHALVAAYLTMPILDEYLDQVGQ